MERRPRSPTGRNAPSKGGASSGGRPPKSGLESGFRKKSDKNFQTRDGKEGFRADSGDKKRSFGDKPKRDFGDRPKRDFSDKPKRDYGDRPQRSDSFKTRSDSDRPKRDYSDKPKRDFGDRPARSFDDRPKRSYGDKPSFGDKPKRDYSDKPKRDFADRPKRDFGDRPARSFDDKPKRSYGDKPSFGDKPKRDYGDKPKRDFGDRPKRDFGDRPARSFDDRPKRSYGDKPSFGDKPKRDFGDRPKRDFGDKPKRSYGDKPTRSGPPRSGPARGGPSRGPRREEERSYGPRIEVTVYGLHAVKSAILNPARTIKAIYATEDDVVDLQPALDEALENGIILPELKIVEREQLHRALPRDAVHQGVGIDAEPLEDLSVQDIIRKAEVKKKSIVLMLDHVTDPHNIGAIIRSACAFGADAVIVQTRNAPELTALIAKTASGAVEHLPLVYETNLSRTIEAMKEAGYYVLALDERGEDIATTPYYEKTLLVLGAEGQGLRPLVKSNCDLTVKLPTSGPISSLNVSNAAAISLFAIASKQPK